MNQTVMCWIMLKKRQQFLIEGLVPLKDLNLLTAKRRFHELFLMLKEFNRFIINMKILKSTVKSKKL